VNEETNASMNLNTRRRRWLVAAGAAALVAWGAAGLYQNAGLGFSGGLYTPDYTVSGIMRGSVAEKAGFEPGDHVISVEGIPVERLGMESRWPRSLVPRAGESRRFLVERKGGRVLLNVAYGPPSRAVLSLRIAPAIFGLAFLGIGLWTLFTVRSEHARALARMGFAAAGSAALGLGPHLGWWNGVQGHVSLAAAVLLFALLLRFFLSFPQSKPVTHSRLATWAVYGPWIFMLVFLIVELIVHPVLYYKTGTVVFPLMLMYGVLALAAILHTLARTPRADLRASGMYLIFGGLVALFVAVPAAVVTGVDIPASGYALAVTAVPLTMALAVRRQARRPRASIS
jgi:hypothetical protein